VRGAGARRRLGRRGRAGAAGGRARCARRPRRRRGVACSVAGRVAPGRALCSVLLRCAAVRHRRPCCGLCGCSAACAHVCEGLHAQPLPGSMLFRPAPAPAPGEGELAGCEVPACDGQRTRGQARALGAGRCAAASRARRWTAWRPACAPSRSRCRGLRTRCRRARCPATRRRAPQGRTRMRMRRTAAAGTPRARCTGAARRWTM